MSNWIATMKTFWAKFGFGEDTRACISIHFSKNGTVDIDSKGDPVDLVFCVFMLQQVLAKDIIKK